MSSRWRRGDLPGVASKPSNFRYSFLFLPREKRRAIESIYAFARRADDLADGDLSPATAGREIALHREALDRCYAYGRASAGDGKPEIEELADCIHRYKIPRHYFEELILGLEMDLKGVRYQTFADLAPYCYRVAGTIGLISIEIFGYRNPQTREYAVNLAMALQLVNILRDLQSDAQRGRVYLPRDELVRFGVTPEQLAEGRLSPGFADLMKFQCERVSYYFGRARRMLPAEDRRSLVAAEIMAAIYWRLLKKIQARGYDIFGNRVRLSNAVKFWAALSVYFGAEWFK